MGRGSGYRDPELGRHIEWELPVSDAVLSLVEDLGRVRGKIKVRSRRDAWCTFCKPQTQERQVFLSSQPQWDLSDRKLWYRQPTSPERDIQHPALTDTHSLAYSLTCLLTHSFKET